MSVRFDPASLAILDRINHAINLLESQQQVSAVIPHRPGPGLTDASPASSTQLGQSVVSNATPLPQSELDEDSLDVPGDPATLINCEAILRWPIFRSCVPPDLQSFILDSDDAYSDTLGPSPAPQRGGVREEDFVKLSGRFLAYVHVKNPILDCSEFRSSVKEAADNGIGWDGPSCLVLIACALGCFEFGDYTIDERSANPRHRPEMKHCEVLGEEINIWCSHIPPPISSNVIEHPPNEFAHFIRNRALACREWIHRPFLYYAIHQPPDDPYIPHILPLVEKCLEVCIQGQFEAYAFRRHHGTCCEEPKVEGPRRMERGGAVIGGNTQILGGGSIRFEMGVHSFRKNSG
ncbi:hypothetical protein SAPIO_CDS1908 [Scedosporium apiospermum]|uniref:Uncharacterized protein n=1 Tax=Pseudallescheria apiosperma TaxID=563466 RepID=A0A084GE09_PSEDA|nr:uncharacterized protein SAPIO_CDS1908 [Scedosporium apiospermum]KEZ45571.1 hypothetical protein SAPIO_CDS1908 [Scedosporium apiospermum]